MIFMVTNYGFVFKKYHPVNNAKLRYSELGSPLLSLTIYTPILVWLLCL